MIANAEVAKQVSGLMLQISEELNESVRTVQECCPDTEFIKYRRAVGAVKGEILLEVLNPIYATHPALKPSGFD